MSLQKRFKARYPKANFSDFKTEDFFGKPNIFFREGDKETAVFDDDGKDFRSSIYFSKEMKRQLGLAPGFPLELCHNPNPKLEIPAVPFHAGEAGEALHTVKDALVQQEKEKIYRALVLPYFDYCSAVWDGLCNRLTDKVQKLQNRAARVILKAKYDTSSSILRNRLSWDTLAIRRKKQKAVLMYKCLNGLVPNYLQNLFTHRCTSYNLRNQEYKITLPKPRTDFLKRSFSYSGAKLWNDLPLSIRSSSSLAQFKREINLIF